MIAFASIACGFLAVILAFGTGCAYESGKSVGLIWRGIGLTFLLLGLSLLGISQ